MNAHHRLQYVCGALDLLERGEGQMPVKYDFEARTDELSGKRCFQLLQRAMRSGTSAAAAAPTSLRDMWSFVNILYTTLTQLHDPASPINAAMAPDPFVLSKVDDAIKQSIKGEICSFLIRTARDFSTNAADDKLISGTGSLDLSCTGFSRQEFNHTPWRIQAYQVAGREAYRLGGRDYLLYFRAGSQRWVIDDEVTPSGAAYAASTTSSLSGAWKTSPGWKIAQGVRVRRNAEGDYVVSGCVGNSSSSGEEDGSSSSALDNGTYVVQPREDMVNGRLQYVLKTPALSALGEQRHLIYSRITKTWKITPTCREEDGSNLIQETEGVREVMPDTGVWLKIPGDVVDNVRFSRAHKPSVAAAAAAEATEEAQEGKDEVDEDDEEEEDKKGENQLAHLVPWSESNHESLLFSNKTSTLAFFSLRHTRLREKMNPNLVKFLELNKIVVGEDLSSDSTRYHQLLCALTNVMRTPQEADELLGGNGGKFAITGDALLKFLAICMRIRCGIPVVLLGECGCGKTYSVKFLAAWLNLRLFCLDVHGGTEEQDVLDIISRAQKYCQDTRERALVFLDEINACAHLGLIEELILQRRAFGKRIDDGLILVAALNPYRVLPPASENSDMAGLKYTGGAAADPMATATNKNLVYLVHPVPQSLAHVAFDYGALKPQEENRYVASMARNTLSSADLPVRLLALATTDNMIELLVAWISAAQYFVREKEGDASAASLRDAQRMLQLTVWFLKLAANRMEKTAQGKDAHIPTHAIIVDCVVLGLAFAYMFRLPSRKLRAAFWERIRENSTTRLLYFPSTAEYRKAGKFESILATTQRSFAAKFQLERGIAMNEALSENLFLCVVCILNRIPLFLVGKPGTSKTLALQIAASNLLGRASPVPFWRRFPGLAVFTYQCSPLSTAVEIRRQFDVACRFQSHASEQVSVFVLDEVGLAEFSPSLPLKVLHSILVDPPCAVIGVSNWTLDRAKMNRAILLTRPEPSVYDLRFTGERISQSLDEAAGGGGAGEKEDWWLEPVATTFYEVYAEEQKSGREFWGMRDFYALVRQLKAAPGGMVDMDVLTVALCRNLGGKPELLEDIVQRFRRAVFGK